MLSLLKKGLCICFVLVGFLWCAPLLNVDLHPAVLATIFIGYFLTWFFVFLLSLIIVACCLVFVKTSLQACVAGCFHLLASMCGRLPSSSVAFFLCLLLWMKSFNNIWRTLPYKMMVRNACNGAADCHFIRNYKVWVCGHQICCCGFQHDTKRGGERVRVS